MKKLVLLLALLPTAALAQATYPGGNPPPPPEATEIWSPVPPKVEPAAVIGQPPSDAIVLFNGKDLSNWESVNGGPAEWGVENGEMVDRPKAGHIETKQKFGDCQLHVEWMVPVLPPDRKGQDRGNSGVFMQGLYEVQVLDTYDNPTYVNGEAGAIYKQSAPLVNALKAARPTGRAMTSSIMRRASITTARWRSRRASLSSSTAFWCRATSPSEARPTIACCRHTRPMATGRSCSRRTTMRCITGISG